MRGRRYRYFELTVAFERTLDELRDSWCDTILTWDLIGMKAEVAVETGDPVEMRGKRPGDAPQARAESLGRRMTGVGNRKDDSGGDPHLTHH